MWWWCEQQWRISQNMIIMTNWKMLTMSNQHVDVLCSFENIPLPTSWTVLPAKMWGCWRMKRDNKIDASQRPAPIPLWWYYDVFDDDYGIMMMLMRLNSVWWWEYCAEYEMKNVAEKNYHTKCRGLNTILSSWQSEGSTIVSGRGIPILWYRLFSTKAPAERRKIR